MGLMTSNDILDALYGSYQPKMSLEQWYGKGNNLSPAYGSGYIYATDPVNGIPYAPMSLSEAAASPEHSAELQNIKNLYSQYEAMPSYRTGKGLLSQVIQNNPEKVGVGLGTDTPEAQQIANLIGMDEAGKNLVVYDRYNLGSDNLNTLVDRYKQLNPHMNVTIADEATGRQYDTNRAWMNMTRRSEKENDWLAQWGAPIGKGIIALAGAALGAATGGAGFVPLGAAIGGGITGGAMSHAANPSGGLGQGLLTFAKGAVPSAAASAVGSSVLSGLDAGSLFNLNPVNPILANAAAAGTKMLTGLGVNSLYNNMYGTDPTGISGVNTTGQSTGSDATATGTNYTANTYSPTESSTGLLSSATNSASGLNTSPVASATSQFDPLDIASTMKTPVDIKDMIADYLKQYGLVNSAYSADKLTDSLKYFSDYVA